MNPGAVSGNVNTWVAEKLLTIGLIVKELSSTCGCIKAVADMCSITILLPDGTSTFMFTEFVVQDC